MWFLPVLVIGAIVAAVASRSPREAADAPPLRLAGASPPPPGPIAVLGEVVRLGYTPPPTVILCAIAEAEALGRDDLAADIIRVFVAPVVQQHAWVPSVPYAGLPLAPLAPPGSPRYQQWSCAEPTHAPAPRYTRGSCAAPQRSVRAMADAAPAPQPLPAPRAPLGLPRRAASDDEIRAMLNADPEGFIAMATRAPVIEAPIARPAAPPLQALAADPPTPGADALVEQLDRLPGHVGAGVVLDLSSGIEVFEVRWLRGYSLPVLPTAIDGRMTRLVIVDELPRAQKTAEQPTGLPPEVVADLQEAAGLHEADPTLALTPGSPLSSVFDDAWRAFVMQLERESPQFSSERHVGQYRQCRDRLAELGIDVGALEGSAQAQRAALDVDLVDAHRHATDGELIARHIGRTVALPGRAAAEKITLSGMLGVIQCAGLEGAVGWLERPGDRKRFPYTTQVFLKTNGIY